MNLLILGNPTLDGPMAEKARYRGTFRTQPRYCNSFPEKHELNQVYSEYVHDGGEVALLHDADKALHLVEVYRRYGIQPDLQVVEVTEHSSPPECGTIFLGYDLSSGFRNSLLWDLVPLPFESVLDKTDLRDRAVMALAHLVGVEVNRSLNTVGLFSDYDLASRCLMFFESIQLLSPGFYEDGDFAVCGLYIVRSNPREIS
jgi:hypothetical protein